MPGLRKVSDWHRILLQGPCWLQLRSATSLDNSLGREVWHHLALQVSQDLPLRKRKVNDVAHPPERVPCQERQIGGDQRTRTRIPAPGQANALVDAAPEERGHLGPKHLWERVLCVARIDEAEGPTHEQRTVLASFLWDNLDHGALLAHPADVLDVDARHHLFSRRFARNGHERSATCVRHCCPLAQTLEKNAALRLQLVNIQALDRLQDLDGRNLQSCGLLGGRHAQSFAQARVVSN
mmetsp:Transcript_26068/g.74662  ORF Transcript_26068/g.74662 Transcript_26068/m.74662 type:complete len:238 (+) Transcript_26068:1490-2203(+)